MYVASSSYCVVYGQRRKQQMQSSFVKAKLFWENQAATKQPQQQPQRGNPPPPQHVQPTQPETPSIVQSTPVADDSPPTEENKRGKDERKVDTSYEKEQEDK